MSYPGACGGCEHRWDSATQAHCARCHRQFGSYDAFDRHLPPSSAPIDAKCKNPARLRRVDMQLLLRCDETAQGPVWKVRKYDENNKEIFA